MPDTRTQLRAWYMMAVHEHLFAEGGRAEIQGVHDGLRRQARDEDLAALRSARSRLDQEIGFAGMMLTRAGLIRGPDPGVWELTDAGRRIQLTPRLSNNVLNALLRLKGGLIDAERVYGAIAAAARAGRMVSDWQLAQACGVVWSRAQTRLPALLRRLDLLSAVRGWPRLSAIVANPGDAVDAEGQARVFAWVETAPERMGVTGSLDAYDAPERADPPAAPYTLDDIVADGCFLAHNELEGMLARLRAKKNLILQGPPGTGKTWLARRLGYALIGARDLGRITVAQFHPSTSYEDFVRGWRPADGRLELTDGVFLRAVEAALSEAGRPFVLVIEEVNRGHPAQIFGEMLTLLEASKRGPEEGLELAYPRSVGERTHIPPNLYVIGTMNLADRSLAPVDLALRRRFGFVSLEPRLNEAWRAWARQIGGMDGGLVELIERRIGALNDEIASDRALGREFRIGHSYVTPTEPVGDDWGWFRAVVETEIGPLLNDYWPDHPDKAQRATAALLEGVG